MQVDYEYEDDVLVLKVESNDFDTHGEFYNRDEGLRMALHVLKQEFDRNPPHMFDTKKVRLSMALDDIMLNGGDVEGDLRRTDGSMVPVT